MTASSRQVDIACPTCGQVIRVGLLTGVVRRDGWVFTVEHRGWSSMAEVEQTANETELQTGLLTAMSRVAQRSGCMEFTVGAA